MLGILFQIIAGILIGVQLITIRIEMIVKCMFLPAAVGTIPNGGLAIGPIRAKFTKKQMEGNKRREKEGNGADLKVL